MAGFSLVDLIESLPDQGATWGPPVTTETTLNGVPYAPYSKGDKLGRMADWTADSKDGRDGRGGRQQYNRNFRDQQVYGAGTTTLFAAPAAEDESSFSVVSNVRDSGKTRFGRGAVFARGRGQRGGRGDSRGGRQQFQRSGRGGQQYGGYSDRGGRGGQGARGGRRFGWKDYDKPTRNRDASVNVKADWKLLEEIDFNRLGKLNLETEDGEDVDSYGFLYSYDRSYDKPAVKSNERKLTALDRAAYNVTTSSDPVIQELAEKDEATIFATDNILSMLMCATRSVYSWDIVIVRQGNKIFLDKRDNAALDMVTVNENAADAPLEASEGSKDSINQPAALAEEATYINHNFATQVVLENQKVEMAHENPFYNAAEETAPPASKAYKYRRFDLSTSEEEPTYLIVRTELDAFQKNAISGDDQYVTVHALNEFDSKAQGSGGALDWRTKLVSQRGAVVATEMKNNSCKLARWTVQSILAKADVMKLGFVSRASPKTNDKHVILGVVGWKPKDFAAQMNLSLSNGWGIVRTIADMCLKREEDGKFVLVKDPNKSILRLYEVPAGSFDDDADEVPETVEEDAEEEGSAQSLTQTRLAPSMMSIPNNTKTKFFFRLKFHPTSSHAFTKKSLHVTARTLEFTHPPHPSTTFAFSRRHPILNYFKKAADESLFMGEGPDLASLGDEEEEEDEDEDENLFGSQQQRETNGAEEQTEPVKKRKLIGADDRISAGNGTFAEARSAARPVANKPAARKKPGNPFLESDSEDEDGPGAGEERPTSADATAKTTVSTGPSVTPAAMGRNEINDDAAVSRTIELLRSETSGSADFGGPVIEEEMEDVIMGDKDDAGQFDDFDNGEEFGFGEDGEGQWGEEFREMRYMREQARLEAEEAGLSVNYGDEGVNGGDMEECCPICSGSLAGMTEGRATEHVNACLDGTPIRIPERSMDGMEGMKIEESLEVVEVGKRFAKAAVPRPGQINPISIPSGVEDGLMSGHAEDAAWAMAAAAEMSSRGMPAYKRTCPFYKIMPGFFICVDAFRYGAVEGCNAYFLSHFHSDHYIGLTANWSHGPIYCSKVTGSLVKSQLKTAEKYVVELEFDQKVPVPGTQGVSVTMIPANHCPGSSLFLFEKLVAGGKRTHRILHCGDFRACPSHISHPELRPETVHAASGKTNQQKIDVCYLDTTYLNPRYSFPPQDDVILSCADLCVALNKGLAEDDETHWNTLLRRREGGAPPGIDSVAKFFQPNNTSPPPDRAKPPDTAFTAIQPGARRRRLLVVCGTYSIGKERICKAIALALNTKIFASPSKIRICKQLDDPELSALMTSDPREAQVHMQMLMEIRAETLAEYLELHSRHFSRIVGFRPSGWNYRPSGGGTNASANLAPGSLPSTTLLHGNGWRTRFRVKDLVPQRGSGNEAMCFGVPYSEHSSFRELAMFLMALRIEKVVPTVNVGSEQSRKRMKGWTDRWLAERRKGGLVRVLEEESDGEEEGKGKERKGVVLWDGKSGKGGGAYW
ncbi:eukaryotic translation initiation factor 3-like protein [Podospora aff. communis PSN243]|uniref:Eukaryotic translation initiation factor 3 subunit D n=1 Tax=Podospora aff. communis PSN243 TaxID=3040156 RepID=A0AAV9GT40_9PEZI|nr:eukaryotic translation initiation factor 3-like protein [Podospora aff. communis PSN243]